MFRNNRIRMAGITLIELLVVIVIAAILMGIAVPSYKNITTSYRISGEINGLLGDMQFARAEAVKEGQNVTICASTNATSSAPTCSGTSWNGGWIVFPTSSAGVGSAVLRIQAPFSSSDTFSDSATSQVVFDRDGLINSSLSTGFPAAGTLILLHDPTANLVYTRCLQISPVGAMLVTQNSANTSCT